MKEIIDLLKKYTDGKQNTEKVEISVLQLNRIIKALEQDSTLDKIRAEIEENIQKETIIDSFGGEYESIVSTVDPDDVLEIIDKYRSEMENEE